MPKLTRVPVAILAASAIATMAVAETSRPRTIEPGRLPKQKAEPPTIRPETAAPLAIVRLDIDRLPADYRPPAVVQLTLTVNRSAYVYIVDRGSNGTVRVVWPNEYEPENRVEAATIVDIPRRGADWGFITRPPAGSGALAVVASLKPLSHREIEQAARLGPLAPSDERIAHARPRSPHITVPAAPSGTTVRHVPYRIVAQ